MMREDLQKRLDLAAERHHQRVKLELKLRLTQQALAEVSAACDRHRATLKAEKADVAKLEGLSLANLLQTMMGSKDKRLQKEKGEVVAAALKLNQSVAERSALEAEAELLISQLDALENTGAVLEAALRAKREYLERTNDLVVTKLVELDSKLAEIAIEQKETSEAIAAGNKAVASLKRVRGVLDSASSWGTIDMIGGGMMTSIIKHNKMSEAQNQVSRARADLRTFSDELNDVGAEIGDQLNLDGLTRFADVFFDNIFTDWSVQQNIGKSRKSCDDSIRRVNQLLEECKRDLIASKKKAEDLQTERREAIGQG